MNGVLLNGILDIAPQVYESPGKIPLVYLKLRVTETVMMPNGTAQNVSNYFPVRCFGRKYLEELKQAMPGLELRVKGRLVRQPYVSKDGNRSDGTYVVINDEYGSIEAINAAINE